MEIAGTTYVSVKETGSVVTLELPDGTKIGLSPRQVAEAIIEPHGNHNRSKLRVKLDIEAQICGDADIVREHIKQKLVEEIESLRRRVK